VKEKGYIEGNDRLYIHETIKCLEVKMWRYKEAISQKEYTFTTIFGI